MKKQINLIPMEMTVSTKTVKLSYILNKLTIIGSILLVIIATVFISDIFYYNIQYKQSSANIALLKQQIIDLEENEQKLILAKDKLSKVLTIKKLDSVDDELTNFQAFESSVSGFSSATFSEITIDPSKTETSLTFKNSNELTNTLDVLSSLTAYKKIILSSLNYSANSGYLVSLIFNN